MIKTKISLSTPRKDHRELLLKALRSKVSVIPQDELDDVLKLISNTFRDSGCRCLDGSTSCTITLANKKWMCTANCETGEFTLWNRTL